MLDRTDRRGAPWHLIAAESKRYARVRVVRTVNEEIEAGCAARARSRRRPSLESGPDPASDHEELYPLSRFRILVLLAALAALATAFAACGGGSDKQQRRPAEGHRQRDPRRGEERHTRPLARDQGRRRRRRRHRRQPLRPVPERRQGNLPQLALNASAKGSAQGRKHRLRRRPDAALRSRLRQLQGHRVRSRPDHLRLRQVGLRTGPAAGRLRRQPGDVTACQEAATGLKVGDFVDNLTNEGSADVDGTARPRSAATSTSAARSTRSSS